MDFLCFMILPLIFQSFSSYIARYLILWFLYLKKWPSKSCDNLLRRNFLWMNTLCKTNKILFIIPNFFSLMSGSCLQGVWKVLKIRMGGVWNVSGKCLEGVCDVQEVIWKVFEGFPKTFFSPKIVLNQFFPPAHNIF